MGDKLLRGSYYIMLKSTYLERIPVCTIPLKCHLRGGAGHYYR